LSFLDVETIKVETATSRFIDVVRFIVRGRLSTTRFISNIFFRDIFIKYNGYYCDTLNSKYSPLRKAFTVFQIKHRGFLTFYVTLSF
jgi:hypothetical protein